MNKTLRTSLIIAAAVAIIGLILAIIGFAAGGLQSVTLGMDGIKIADDYNDKKILNESFGSIKSIDVNLDLRDIIFKKGAGYKIESNGVDKNFKIEDNNGNLTITENSDSKFTLNLFGFGFGENNQNSDIIITYPSGSEFDKIKINSNWGMISISDLKAKDLNLFADLGDIELTNVISSRSYVKIDSGSLHLKNTSLDVLNFELGLGDVEAEGFIGKKITGNLNSGNAELEGVVNGPIDISDNLGDVELTLKAIEKSYSYELTTDLGDIELNGQESGGNLTKVYDNKPLIKITNDAGDISVDFKPI